MKDIFDDGGKLYTCYNGTMLVGACLLDIVEDNHSIEIIGRFGDNDEIRKQRLDKIRTYYKDYKFILYATDKNIFVKNGKVFSCDLYMKLKKQYNCNVNNVFKLEKEDIEAFSNIHDVLFSNAYDNGHTLSNLDEETIFVYKKDDKVLGYIAFNKNDLYIDFVGVLLNERKKGIGTSLVNKALKDMNYNQEIHLSVGHNNIAAINLYKQCGFIVIKKMISVSLQIITGKIMVKVDFFYK